MIDPVPKDLHTITPQLVVKGVAGAIDWYTLALGAHELLRNMAPDGTSIMHAELLLGDSRFFVVDEFPESMVSPATLGGTAVTLHLYVRDVDEPYRGQLRRHVRVSIGRNACNFATYHESAIWHGAWTLPCHELERAHDRRSHMNSIATGITAALISGAVMYTVGANAPVNAFSQNPALVQTVDGQFVPASTTTALRPAAMPSAPTVTPVSNTRRASAPRRTVSNTEATAAPSRQVYNDEDVRPERSWGKTAMVIGGSAAGGAGVGGIVGGKKGALIGAAIGGGAASIFEATQRR